MKRKYDLYFSLGGSCKGNMSLREAGLQLLTFPLDWCGGPRMAEKAPHINSGFAGFMDEANLEKLPVPPTSQNQLYLDRKFGYTIIHEFHVSVPFEQELPIVKARFARRFARFLSLLDRAKTVLIVYVNVPTAPTETAVEARRLIAELSARRPNTRFDVLLFNHVAGVKPDAAQNVEDGNVRMVGFDFVYRDSSDGQEVADQFKIGDWLKANYEVDDYRTPEEIEAWRKRRKTAKYDRFKAKNFFDYLITKIEYKFYRHLIKKMEKKGLA